MYSSGCRNHRIIAVDPVIDVVPILPHLLHADADIPAAGGLAQGHPGAAYGGGGLEPGYAAVWAGGSAGGAAISYQRPLQTRDGAGDH